MIRLVAVIIVATLVGTWWMLVSWRQSWHSSRVVLKGGVETVEPVEHENALGTKWHPQWSLREVLDPMNNNYTYDNYLSDIPEKMVGSLAEYHQRQKLFEYNKQIIRRHNQNQQHQRGGHMLGINDFMDRFDSELPQAGYDKSQHVAWKRNAIDDSIRTVSDSTSSFPTHELDYWTMLEELTFGSSEELPDTVDWRIDAKSGKPLATAVKAQGSCGSCWAFATTAAIESHVAMGSPNHTLMSLSMQELVSCVPNPHHCGGSGGCGGSTAELALEYVAQKGMVDEWHLGYQSYDGSNTVPCSLKSTANANGLFVDAVADVRGYARLPSNNYTALMQAVAKKGPVIVNVASDPWRFYKSGVFTTNGKSSDQTDINHVVVLMGYGTDEETGDDYWLVRNSYGPRWGEEGYIRLKRVDPATLPHPDSDCGMDVRPADGIACTTEDHGHRHITPPAVKVCGTSGILFDPVMPIGARML